MKSIVWLPALYDVLFVLLLSMPSAFFVPVHGILSSLPAFIGSKHGGDSPCNTE